MAVTIKQQKEPWADPNAEPYIEIVNISKSFDQVSALRHVSLSIYKNEFFSLLGASGCGKTTLLRILAGFERPTSGRIFIDGVDVTDYQPYRRPVNMMFQSYALFPHMTVYDNVAFGLHFEKIAAKELKERVEDALDLVQMGSYQYRFPNQLSGGQKQRVALARSLVKHPKLILLDEPLGALDKKLREQTQFELVNIQEKVGITFIMVTHDQEEAMTMSSRLCIMREGEAVQVGMPHEIYEYPNSTYVANFIGTVNLFEGIVTGQSEGYVEIDSYEIGCPLKVTCTATAPIGSHTTIAIRPEKIMISKDPWEGEYNIAKGIVSEIAYLGDISIYYVALESGKVIQASLPNLYRLSAERSLTWDDEVYVTWRPQNGVMLNI